MNEEVQENLKRSEVETLGKQAGATRKVNFAIEQLNKQLESLESKFVESSKSSAKVAVALNILTGALVLVGVAQVVMAVCIKAT
jgi:hypothetical protein